MRNIILAIALSLAGGCAPVYPVICADGGGYTCNGQPLHTGEVMQACGAGIVTCAAGMRAACTTGQPWLNALECTNGTVSETGRFQP